jgi:hypothetical protein
MATLSTPPEALPPRLDEELDVNGDGTPDLRLAVDTTASAATLTPLAPWCWS